MVSMSSYHMTAGGVYTLGEHADSYTEVDLGLEAHCSTAPPPLPHSQITFKTN